MKFPQYENQSQTMHIPAFSKGIRLTDNAHSSQSDSLSDCKNLWYKDDALTSREGISTNEKMELNSKEIFRRIYESWKTTDIDVEINGDLKRLVLETVECDIARHVCFTHIINSDGTVFAKPYMEFLRLDSNIFRIPYKVNIYKGSSQEGCGIFAIVYLINYEDYTMQTITVFELNKNYTLWNRIQSLYVPTVLVNGRGNRYDFATQSNQAYAGTPIELEGLNMLDGTFKAYFSSDGYSSMFRLPHGDLAYREVSCKIYSSADEYVRWTIDAYSTYTTASYKNVEIEMHIDRKTGIVYFRNSNQDWPVPLYYDQNQNNICITATKSLPNAALEIANASACYSQGNTILFGYKNKIYETHCRNPLYFSLKSCITVGSEASSVTGFSQMGQNIAVFKQNEIHMLSINEGKLLNTPAILGDNDAAFYGADTFTVKHISSSVGCPRQNLIVNHNKHVYFLSGDDRIFSLDSSGKATVLYDDLKINELLEVSRYSGIFAVLLKNDIVFMAPHRALVFHLNKENDLSCYFWQFPEEISIHGAYSSYGNLRIFCHNPTDKIYFIATLSGNKDMLNFEEAVDIPVSFRTTKLNFGCDNSLKKINSIILNLKGSARIFVNDKLQANVNQYENHNFSRIRLSPSAYGINLMDIALEGKAPISIGSTDINFTTLKA